MTVSTNNTFVFDCYNEIEEKSTVYSFVISPNTQEQLNFLNQIDGGYSDEFDEFVELMESGYGVHDVSFNPDIEFYGFTSYEVPADEEEELIRRWRVFFELRGFTLSDVVITKDTEV